MKLQDEQENNRVLIFSISHCDLEFIDMDSYYLIIYMSQKGCSSVN